MTNRLWILSLSTGVEVVSQCMAWMVNYKVITAFVHTNTKSSINLFLPIILHYMDIPSLPLLAHKQQWSPCQASPEICCRCPRARESPGIITVYETYHLSFNTVNNQYVYIQYLPGFERNPIRDVIMHKLCILFRSSWNTNSTLRYRPGNIDRTYGIWTLYYTRIHSITYWFTKVDAPPKLLQSYFRYLHTYR